MVSCNLLLIKETVMMHIHPLIVGEILRIGIITLLLAVLVGCDSAL